LIVLLTKVGRPTDQVRLLDPVVANQTANFE
jgi:hypothetical protein